MNRQAGSTYRQGTLANVSFLNLNFLPSPSPVTWEGVSYEGHLKKLDMKLHRKWNTNTNAILNIRMYQEMENQVQCTVHIFT